MYITKYWQNIFKNNLVALSKTTMALNFVFFVSPNMKPFRLFLVLENFCVFCSKMGPKLVIKPEQAYENEVMSRKHVKKLTGKTLAELDDYLMS